MPLRIAVALTTICVLLVGCAPHRYMTQAGAGRGKIDVIAHRGASAHAPENTLAAFRLAMEMEADWFHLNARLTGDDEVVVIHDETVDRTTDGSGGVRDFTLAELKELDAGSWKGEDFAGEQIPSLGEALDLARGRRDTVSEAIDFARRRIGVYVELQPLGEDRQVKSHLMSIAADHRELLPDHSDRVYDLLDASRSHNYHLARRAVDLIKDRNMERQVVIQSSSPIIIATVRSIDRNIRTEYLDRVAPWDDDWRMFVRWIQLTNPYGVNLDHERMTREQLEYFQQAGRKVHLWTVNEPEAMRELAEWGVDGIITDYPDVALDVLREMGKR